MADKKETKARPGQTVEVVIKRRKKRVITTRPVDDRRYGPPPFLDDENNRRKKKSTTVYFLNQQAEMSRSNAFFSTPQQELKYLHKWQYESIGLDQFSLDKNFGIRRYSDATTFVTYRNAWNRHPLPYDFADDYGISLLINGQANSLATSNDDWKEYSPYITEAALLVRQENGEDVTAELANNALEIEEWEAAYDSDFTFWIEPLVDWHRNHGYLQKRISRKSKFAIANSGLSFEAFDPFDTTNFKVTHGEYDDPEVAAPRLNNARANDLRIGLIPRMWDFTVEYFGWYYQAIPVSPDARIWKKSHAFTGKAPAITTPLIFGNPNVDPTGESPAIDLYNDVNQYTRTETALPDGLEDLGDNTQVYTFTGIPVDPTPAPFDDEYIFYKLSIFMEGSNIQDITLDEMDYATSEPDYPAFVRRIFERSDATLEVVERDLEEGQIVGCFRLNGSDHYVYRKTSEVRSASIYNGPVNMPGNWTEPYNGAGLGFDLEEDINPYLFSDSRDFAYFDPDDLYDHFTE